MLQSAPANQRRACRVSWTLTAFVLSHLHRVVSLSLEIATRTSTIMSLIKQPWGVVSGCCVSRPHGDRQSKVKGRGPVSTSADLILSSVSHKYVYMSVSISNHCWVSVVDLNFGIGKSTSIRDHFLIPVANVF